METNKIIAKINDIRILDIDGELNDLNIEFILSDKISSISAEIYDNGKSICFGCLDDIFDYFKIKYNSLERYPEDSKIGKILTAIHNFFENEIKGIEGYCGNE